MTAPQPRRAAFLDRDGVINADTGYVHRWDDFQFLPGVEEAISRLARADYQVVVVTNQSGIGRGLYSAADYEKLTQNMLRHLNAAGAPVLAVYHCPHAPGSSADGGACDCRKPLPGMLLRAAREHRLDLAQSLLVGDKESDVQAGWAAGVGATILVRGNYPLSPDVCHRVDRVCESLTDAVEYVLRDQG